MTVDSPRVNISNGSIDFKWGFDDCASVGTNSVQIDELGWSVEMEIPFSNLFFHEEDAMIWGMNLTRFIIWQPFYQPEQNFSPSQHMM